MARMNVKVQNPPLVRLEPFRGMNVNGSPTEISNNESPDMKNVISDQNGAISKRTGYERVMNLGIGTIKGAFLYHKSTGEEIFLIAHGGKLYKSAIPQPGLDFATWEQDDLTQTWEV